MPKLSTELRPSTDVTQRRLTLLTIFSPSNLRKRLAVNVSDVCLQQIRQMLRGCVLISDVNFGRFTGIPDPRTRVRIVLAVAQ